MTIFQIKTDLFALIRQLMTDQYGLDKKSSPKWSINSLFFIPADPNHGFISSNFALQLYPLLKAEAVLPAGAPDPVSLANQLQTKLFESIKNSQLATYIIDVQVAGPGFLNFIASDQLFWENAIAAEKNKNDWGKNQQNIDKTILVEFTDPNPFKEFHVGHLMSNCIGESLARMYEFSGAEVKRLCYQGDVGMHVAKTLWAWQQALTQEPTLTEDLLNKDLKEQVKMLGHWYSVGSQAYAGEDEAVKNEIKLINKEVFSKANNDINRLYDLGKKWSLQAFELIYTQLGTAFDGYYFESETASIGEKIVRDHLGDIFVESQNAIIYPGEKYGLHSRVFINSQGLPTYESKELGLAVKKEADFDFDLSIILTGNEVNGYFAVLLSALSQMYPEIAARTVHLGHGMLRLPEGKMSSRTGNVITGVELISLVVEQIKTVNPDISSELAQTLAVSAIKFSLLKQSIGKDVVFDISDSVSLHGATGTYLQYTHARISSLLNKSTYSDLDEVKDLTFNHELLPILRELFYFPHIVSQAIQTHSPSDIANYLLKLAQLYNSYYSENRIIGSEQEQASLFISQVVKVTLHNGLYMLGISSVDKM